MTRTFFGCSAWSPMSGRLRPRRPAPVAGFTKMIASSTASPSMTESVARIKRTLFLLRPSARFRASRARTCPRWIARSFIDPKAGRMCLARFWRYEANVFASTLTAI